MSLDAVKAGPVATGTDLRNAVLANTSDHIRLEALRVQYLAEIFDMTASTAVTVTIGFKPDGEVGEIFLNADRADSMLDVLMSDAAIIASIALQYGASVRQLAHAIKRDRFGIASSPIGAALDRISSPEVL